MKIIAKNLKDTQTFSHNLAKCCNCLKNSLVIYLIGELGAGKTTIAQNFIKFFGFDKVKSPTYTLVESYKNKLVDINHFDLYRLNNAEELEYIGIKEYLEPNSLQLIEWPEFGKNFIAKADICIRLEGNYNERVIDIKSYSKIGEKVLNCYTK